MTPFTWTSLQECAALIDADTPGCFYCCVVIAVALGGSGVFILLFGFLFFSVFLKLNKLYSIFD